MPGVGADGTIITGRTALTDAENAQVRELLAMCNAAERLDLKVDIASLRGGSSDASRIFLAYRNGALVGFITLDGGREIELCGAVHPDSRRHGIGRALLTAARAECQRRTATKVLLICEDDSRSGQAFVATLDVPRDFSEIRMERDERTAGAPPPALERLALRLAMSGDRHAIAHITGLAFERDEADERARLAADMENAAERFYIALHGNIPVGTLKIAYEPPRALIYGFAVLPEFQGMGYGREILNRMVGLLSQEGWARVGLEVDTENTRAYNLYVSAGFQRVTTYGYYALPL